jgi:NAD-dependent deacetylase
MNDKKIYSKPHLVVFSGAGMSAESGIKTFRDNDGLWENHEVTDVATPEAWRRDPELVLRFYNMRRKQLLAAKPNKAHKTVAELESSFRVSVITQNIDDLHEKAGSTEVMHLHGELRKVQSEKYPQLVYDWEKESIELGDTCEKGYQLRPHVVWFGESVPMIPKAYELAATADIFIVIGTSLNVYPAAGIVNFVPPTAECYLIDPNISANLVPENWTILKTTAGKGMEVLKNELINS